MGRVSLVRHRGEIGETIFRALELIGGLAAFIRPNERVLLKPNLNGVDSFTNIALTERILEMVLDLRARPFLAEATFGDAEMTRMFFRKTGYADLAARYGVPLYNLNESEAVDVPVAKPLVTDHLSIAREVLEAERIVNLPCMKVHYATGITLCMKNLKGMMVGAAKRRFHEIGLDDAIVDLNATLHPHLNIVDAITCMERMGPRGGDVFDLDLVLAGEDAAEVDLIGMQVMGYTLEEVGHLRRYLELHPIDLAAIQVLGERVDNVRRLFRKVDQQGVVPAEFTVHASDACSSCMNAFLLACTLLEDRPPACFEVCMGSRREATRGDGEVIAWGKCCPVEPGDVVIKGCPPYPFALKEQMSAHKESR